MNDEIKIETPESFAQNGITEAPIVAANSIGNVSAASRQFAEVKGMIELARLFPRDDVDAFKKMKTFCARPKFADGALYAYPRGGEVVSGASIKLIEALAKAYRNLDYGFRVMEMRGDKSLVEAFSWDMEDNVRVRREFWVVHERETKSGNYQIKSHRDTYELIANMAQRRVRACLEEVLPVDLVEEAKYLCKKTMAGGGDMPFNDRVREMLLSFDEVGVSVQMIESFLGHNKEAIVVEEFPKLRQVFNSIKNGIAKREDFFDVPPPSGEIPDPVSRNEEKTEDEKDSNTDKEEVIDEETGEVLQQENTQKDEMTEEEIAEIEEEERKQYEQEQSHRAVVEQKENTEQKNGDLNLESPPPTRSNGGRRQRQPRASKAK